MFGFGKTRVDLQAPFAGRIIPVSEVPDPVFSQGMVGDGFAVVPDDAAEVIEVCAPADGTLAKVFKTRHAFALATADGLEVLVHIGLDTVELKGEGFEALSDTGDLITAGQPIMRVDAAALRTAGVSLITPVVMTNKKQVGSLKVSTGPAAVGDTAATVTMA